MPELLLEIIPHLRSRSLGQIKIVGGAAPSGDALPGKNLWEQLDKVLSGDIFSGLKHIIFGGLDSPAFVEELEKHMPLSRARDSTA